MSTHDAEVIVVGGGPAGAATAWLLARGGRDVLLLERAQFPRGKACAEYVSPEACRILDTMGVVEGVRNAGAAILTGMRVRAPSGSELLGEFGAARERRSVYTDGFALRREKLDPLILDAAMREGVRVRERTHVVDVARDSAGSVAGVQLEDGATLRSRFVVGADGLKSVIARRLELGARSRWPRRVAFVTHYEGVEPMQKHGEMHVDRRGYVGLAPVDSGLVNVAVVIPAQSSRSVNGDPESFVDAWLRERPHLAPRFARARRATPVRSIGPFAWSTRKAWVRGAALVGDAADFFDPFTGEGIYSALRGAEILAPYVHAYCSAKDERDAREALQAYERCRHDEFRGKWAVERLVGYAVSWPGFMNRAVRGMGRRRALADTFVGVTGDVVPASAVLRPRYLLALAHAAFF